MNSEHLKKATISALKTILWGTAGLLILSLIYAPFCFCRIDKHEVGFSYNRFTGEIQQLNRQGWIMMWWPKYTVHTIDCRPYQIQITANTNVGNRVLNAKLVRFKPEGIETFIAWHGRDAGNDLENLKEIFKCYVFAPDGGKSCPFIEVLPPLTEK